MFVNESVNSAGTGKDRHLYKRGKMEVKAVLLFLVLVIPASVAFQWTSSSQILDGSSFRACVGDRASFPWSFSLSTGEHVISVEWCRTTADKGQVLVAALVAGHFFPNAGQNVTFVPAAGLQVGHLSLAEFGTYSVRVNYNNNGSLLSSQQTAFLTMEDAPVLAEGQMVANVCPEPVLDDVTGRLHIQLMCGHFLSLGSRPVSVVWKTPSDHTVASTDYINGTFRLNLPQPIQGGRYYCHLKDPSVAARCIPNVSRLMRGAFIYVDDVQIRRTLLEAEFSRLAEITDMLLTRTEKLTSDNERITSDNEKLKRQTEKLTSDNNELRSQMQSVASQLTAETTKLSSRVDNMATNISDISKQLLAHKSRSVTTCPDGWAKFESSCYGVGTELVTWGDAQVICGVHGGHLAEVDSFAENEFVRKFVRSSGSPGIWLGAVDVFNDGHWVWATDGRPVTISYWGPGERTENRDGSEDCMATDARSNFRWVDVGCQYLRYFVCEIRLS